MLQEISLEGKTALITGGGTGIGFAIAEEMADAGASVIIVGRREEKLKEAAEKIGEKCSWYVFDVTKTEEYEDFFRNWKRKRRWIFWSIMRESILRRTILILRQRNLIRLWKRRQRRRLCCHRQRQNI